MKAKQACGETRRGAVGSVRTTLMARLRKATKARRKECGGGKKCATGARQVDTTKRRQKPEYGLTRRGFVEPVIRRDEHTSKRARSGGGMAYCSRQPRSHWKGGHETPRTRYLLSPRRTVPRRPVQCVRPPAAYILVLAPCTVPSAPRAAHPVPRYPISRSFPFWLCFYEIGRLVTLSPTRARSLTKVSPDLTL